MTNEKNKSTLVQAADAWLEDEPRYEYTEEIRYREGQSLRITTGGPYTETWKDWKDEEHGSGAVSLVMHLEGCDRAVAESLLRREGIRWEAAAGSRTRRLTAPSQHRTALTGTQTPSPSKTASQARYVLDNAVSAERGLPRLYLARRKCWPPPRVRKDIPSSVRWLPREARGDLWMPPRAAGFMVYLFAVPGREPDVVEVDAITYRGKHLPTRYRRYYKLRDSMRGRVFSASDDCEGALTLVEGPCSALAVAMAQPFGCVRAAGGTSLLTPEACVDRENRTVRILCDSDASGMKAARKLHVLLNQRGRICYKQRPPRGKDPANVVGDYIAEMYREIGNVRKTWLAFLAMVQDEIDIFDNKEVGFACTA